ncbi:MAG: 2Fe-2S iron-sulfur cluster-binding protein [Syntrophales bacterium]|nr:2Fe-2S iron-sulfur cluster-binding protein [Syntrophales bacterium]
MVSFTIDGRRIEAEEGRTILEVAKERGIEIPTLCHHAALSPTGSCRMCVVEIAKNGRSRIVTSCIYKVEDGLVVNTKSERVKAVRKLVLQLLMARCPDSEVIREMAIEMGVKPESRFKVSKEKGKCILCRLCVKACESIVGVSAIGLSGRGQRKRVGGPFMEAPATCIGCGSCVYICPTGHIAMEDDGRGTRKIWGKTFEMASCQICGRYFAPKEQLEYISRSTGVSLDNLVICTSCR